MADPRIAVVTPSFNQGRYLEAAIGSVLGQRYGGLEYSIFDGGSTDGSVHIIESYADRLHYWQSKPDGGQSAALQAGFSGSTADIFGWLNSDDVMEPGCFARVAEEFESQSGPILLVGRARYMDESGARLGLFESQPTPPEDLLRFWRAWPIAQPATFFSREAYEAVGGIDPSLEYAMDLDLFLRISQRFPVVWIEETLASFRVHPDAKSYDWRRVRADFWREGLAATRHLWPKGVRRLGLELDSRLHLLRADVDRRVFGAGSASHG